MVREPGVRDTSSLSARISLSPSLGRSSAQTECPCRRQSMVTIHAKSRKARLHRRAPCESLPRPRVPCLWPREWRRLSAVPEDRSDERMDRIGRPMPARGAFKAPFDRQARDSNNVMVRKIGRERFPGRIQTGLGTFPPYGDRCRRPRSLVTLFPARSYLVSACPARSSHSTTSQATWGNIGAHSRTRSVRLRQCAGVHFLRPWRFAHQPMDFVAAPFRRLLFVPEV